MTTRKNYDVTDKTDGQLLFEACVLDERTWDAISAKEWWENAAKLYDRRKTERDLASDRSKLRAALDALGGSVAKLAAKRKCSRMTIYREMERVGLPVARGR